MKVSYLTALAVAAAGGADAFFRVLCEDRLTLSRMDPIVNPGKMSAHAHTIHGPNTIHSKATFADLANNECSSCALKLDDSAYWTPALYYVEAGGEKFHPVPQAGGMLAYYFFYNETKVDTWNPGSKQNWGNENIEVFPEDFRMIAGNPSRRSAPAVDPSSQDYRSYKAIGFNCLGAGGENEDSLLHHEWRKDDWRRCKHGVRAELHFPACWDGRSDSPNHKDHMAYPDEVKFGKCPDSHPRRLPAIMFETVWKVQDIAERGFEGGEFVWANGDPTGLSYHGDFQNAWKAGVLEAAMKEPTCYDDSKSGGGNLADCKLFKPEDIRSREEQEGCKYKFKPEWEEDLGFGTGFNAASSGSSSPLSGLPGCNQISRGPENAPKSIVCDTEGRPIDGSAAAPVPAEGLLRDDSKGKGVNNETPKEVAEEPKPEPTPESAVSTLEAAPAPVTPVVEPTPEPASTTSNKYLVIVTETRTRTVTEGEPIPTEWLRRRHMHGKHRRHHKH